MSNVQQRLLHQAPVLDPGTGMTLLSSYTDVERLLRSTDTSCARWSEPDRLNWPNADLRLLNSSIINLDDPQHTRIRRLSARQFSVPTVERIWRPRIRAIVGDLVAQARARGRADTVTDFGYPLAIRVIADALSIDTGDFGEYRRLRDVIVASNVPMVDDETRARANDAATVLVALYRQLLADRRAEPRSDITSLLLEPALDGDHLTEDEVLAALHLVLVAGFETTAHSVSSATLAMMLNPEEIDHLRANPHLLPLAAEECLRWNGHIISTLERKLLADHEVGGVTLPAGSHVSCAIGATNRDPDHFPDPDCFDITRPPGKHLAFGAGPHACLGAAMARCELQEGLKALFIDHDPPRLACQELDWAEQGPLRSLRSLPIVWDR